MKTKTAAPTLADIEAARKRIDGIARVTPVYPSETLSRLAGRPIQLFGLRHLGARPRLDAADVEDLGTVFGEDLGAAEQVVECERRAAVVERVRGAVQDAHDERPATQRQRGAVGEGDGVALADGDRHAPVHASARP